MKNQLLILLFLIISGSTVAQNDPFQKERYEVIDALFTNVDTEKGNESKIFTRIYDWVHFRDFPKEANMIVEQQKLIYDQKTEVIHASYGVYTRFDDFLSSTGTSYYLSPGETSHLIVVKL